MKQYRHTVEKIRPENTTSFDQQFWPVLIAVIVLCSIAAGAIATLVQGPWMWGSLLLLPAAAALAIFLLYRLNNNLLRRSLQLGILISLALHLLVLIITSLTVIFGIASPRQETVVVKTPERRMVISNRNRKFVFQESPKHDVQDEQRIEPEKKQPTTDQNKPQPVPVIEKKQTVDPQLTKREVTQQSIPRLAKKQSQRSRNNQSKPTSASSASVPKPAPNRSAQTAAQSSPSATPVTRQTRKQTSASKSSSTTIANRRPIESQANRRFSQAQKIQQRNNEATARIRKSQAKIPRIALEKSSQTLPNKSTQSINQITRTESSQAVVRRNSPTQSTIQKTSQPRISPSQSAATSRTERRSDTQIARIQLQPTPRNNQRQLVAKSPSSNSNPQFSQVAASSKNSRPVPQPKNVAVTRSQTGKAGSGRSKNLERAVGGQPSPVQVASNAANKRQTNRVSQNISMNSSQKSTTLERGRSEISKRTLRSETANWASKSGSSVPAEMTVQASSASISSSNAANPSSSAAEKGSSMLNIGATKIVPEMVADRRGGGGSPELSNTLAQQTPRQSGRQSNQVPNIANQMQGAFNGPQRESESSQVAAEQGSSVAEIARSNPGQTASGLTGKSERNENDGGTSTDLNVEEIASSGRRRSDQDSLESGASSEFSGERPADGNERTRIAQAPRIERTVDFGSSGESNFEVANFANQKDSITSELVRTATDSLSGGSVLGATSKVVAGSLAGMPLFGNGTGKSKRRSDSNLDIESEYDSDISSRSRSGVAPAPSVQMDINSALNRAATSEILVAESGESGLERRETDRSATNSGVKLEIDAESGPGGFADVVSRRVGLQTDAITESDNLSPSNESRFKRNEFGGIPSVSPNAAIAKQAFQGRNPANLASGGPQTEKAIEMGLEFLARCQLTDGSWTLGQFDQNDPYFQNQLNSDTAATGLALLAFQGAGYNHREFKYAGRIKNALDWLISKQKDNGCLFVESDSISNDSCLMYSHAIAALALAEAYGMTQDPEIKAPAQRALEYISNTQHSRKGGWRYFANPSKRSSDTSVTGWMMMALKSGQLAGLEVDGETMRGIENWLRVAEVPDSKSEFRYNPYAADSEGKSRTHGRRASVTMTAVGLLMRVYTGWGPTDPRFLQGAETLLKQLPSDADSRKRDTYYWYYATQVMKHAGGDLWEQWSAKLHPVLVNTQEQTGPMQGSWHPYKPVPDRWAPQGGRIYVTTMNLLSLEVRYRLLPLYESTIQFNE